MRGSTPHREGADGAFVEVDLGMLPILVGLVAIPMQNLTEWPSRITQYLGWFVVRPVFAAGEPSGGQAFCRDSELDVLNCSAERTEKDGLVVRTMLGVPFRSSGLAKARLRNGAHARMGVRNLRELLLA